MKRFVTTLTLMASALLLAGVSPVSAEEVQLSKKQVSELITTAKTPEEHLKLAAWFNQEAAALEAEAQDHQDFATAWRGRPTVANAKGPMAGKTAAHCDYFAKSVREAAKADRALASEHELMAKGAK